MQPYIDTHCTYEEVYFPTHAYIFTGPCKVTGKPYTVCIPAQALFAYRQGAYIQDAMWMLQPEDREFVMTGISPEGWEQLFGKG